MSRFTHDIPADERAYSNIITMLLREKGRQATRSSTRRMSPNMHFQFVDQRVVRKKMTPGPFPVACVEDIFHKHAVVGIWYVYPYVIFDVLV